MALRAEERRDKLRKAAGRDVYKRQFPAFVLSNGSSLALFVGRVIARLRRNYEKDNYIKR